MTTKPNLTCPFGSVCEEIKDNTLHRCRAYTQIAGRHPQTGEETNDWKCSVFEWQPILLLEIAKTNLGQTTAIESFRNESVQHNMAAVNALTNALSAPLMVLGDDNG